MNRGTTGVYFLSQKSETYLYFLELHYGLWQCRTNSYIWIQLFPETLNSWNLLSSFIKSFFYPKCIKQKVYGIFNMNPNPQWYTQSSWSKIFHSFTCWPLFHISISIISPICSCKENQSETVEHYLLWCPIYSLKISELFKKLRLIITLLTFNSPTYTCNLLWFGNPCYDFYSNNKLLSCQFVLLVP